jgi:hypothetical protein
MDPRRAREIHDAVKMGDFTIIRPYTFGYDAHRIGYDRYGRLTVLGELGEVKEVLVGGEKQVRMLRGENFRLRQRLRDYKTLLSAYEKAIPLKQSVEGTGEGWVGYVESHHRPPTEHNRKRSKMLWNGK